mgnify:CR=1 FL=1
MALYVQPDAHPSDGLICDTLVHLLSVARKVHPGAQVAEDGEVVTISEWDSEAAAKDWGRHPEHAIVQARGRGEYYLSYASISCNEPRVSNFGGHEG